MPFQSADIIFFAIVAVYLAIKLFSVLGRKNDEDENIQSKAPQQKSSFGFGGLISEPSQNNINLNNQNLSPKIVEVEKNKLENFAFSDLSAKSGVEEIISKDSSFTIESFIEGAKMAFEMLFKAYSAKDKETLKDLLSEELYSGFDSQFENLSSKGFVETKSLVAIENLEIANAVMSSSRARIGIKFLSEQINFIKDSVGNVVSGDTKNIEMVEDIWIFERNIRSANPNWTIVSL